MVKQDYLASWETRPQRLNVILVIFSLEEKSYLAAEKIPMKQWSIVNLECKIIPVLVILRLLLFPFLCASLSQFPLSPDYCFFPTNKRWQILDALAGERDFHDHQQQPRVEIIIRNTIWWPDFRSRVRLSELWGGSISCELWVLAQVQLHASQCLTHRVPYHPTSTSSYAALYLLNTFMDCIFHLMLFCSWMIGPHLSIIWFDNGHGSKSIQNLV